MKRWTLYVSLFVILTRRLKAEYLLGLRSPTNGSVFDETSGMLKWIAAGRYGGYLTAPSMPHPSETDLTGEEAFAALVATVGREWSSITWTNKAQLMTNA